MDAGLVLNIPLLKKLKVDGVGMGIELADTDFREGKVVFENTKTAKKQVVVSDFLIGADGAFSAVRQQMVSKHQHQYEYNEIEHDYKELLIQQKKS